MKATLSKLGIDGFLLAIITMVLLAWLFPGPGIATKPIPLEEVGNYGVSVIFLFYGLRLSPEKMKAGLANWKMHLVIQFTTFVLFPVLILLAKPLFNESYFPLWLGIFFLAALPSTVSSSVVMVSIAKGNMPAAIFNASLSSLLGIFITPLWTGLFIAADTGGFDTSKIVLKLCLQVLLPVIAGLVLHRWLGAFAEKHKKTLKTFDQAVILLIIYTSFCHSFAEHLFDNLGITTILLLAAGMIGLFLMIFGLMNLISRILGFSKEDQVTVVFCGSKKSLVHGTVMSKVLFPDSTLAGIMILPLMIYHALQLIAASIIAQKMGRQSASSTTPK
ncbi:bile acid:sodium symporter [Terrimonas sp. NA20]|uniref:Bile acid:sodium symporter n=1 Tax=Terrimonas ginsenosidimutans TaxID=2908004 RepID=A0ABS9KYB9_9BACT|nr:bile acid:sodium symporter family protein [Terrimonas ginsenosidimutans]MCG2617214.1 bile acid:sodium symporter [Terrimonas ginsenosidimutans]